VAVHIETAQHPRLRAAAFTTRLAAPLGEAPVPPQIAALLRRDATAPLSPTEGVRQAVRDMLRVFGYKPTGRGKPAAEYLVRAVSEDALDSINLVVDVCNAVSLHSGLPISVVDTELALPPWRIAVADAGERYVFNRAGHEIDLAGLPCLYDAMGPCGNAVKDAQRTKTSDTTVATLSVIWGVAGHEQRLTDTLQWYRSLLAAAGATTEPVGTDG
jgi:DNA/RNA-binding domain of Phe-tRNA-synthetase-like protein